MESFLVSSSSVIFLSRAPVMSVWKVVFFSVFLHMAYGSMRVTASLDALANGFGAFQVGVLMSLLALFPTLLAMPGGRWIDRAGGRKPIVLSSALLLAAAAAGVLFPAGSFGLAPLYAVVVLDGIGFLFLQMATLEIVGKVSRPEVRTSSFAVLALGFATSGLVNPVIAGYAIDLAGFRAAYGISVLYVAMGFALFLLFRSVIPASWWTGPKKRGKKGAFDLMRLPSVRNVILVSALVSMAWELENFMFPVYGHAIGLTAVRLLIPVMTRWFSEWQFLVLVLALGGASYLVFPFFSTLPPLLAVAFVLGLGLGASQPNVMSLLHRVTPEGRVGEALGVRTMFRNAAHTVLPVGFGAITAAIGVFWIFMFQGALMLGASALVHFREAVRDRRR